MNRQQRRAAGREQPAGHGRTSRPGVEALLAAGVASHRSGRLSEAESCYRQALGLQPGNADANHLLGIIAIQTGRPDLAVDLIRKAILVNERSAIYFGDLGTALKRLGKLDEAVEAYRCAVRLAPADAGAHYNLGAALFDLDRLDESIAACREAVRIHPQFAQAHYNLGIALSAQSQFDQAIAAYRNAIRFSPNLAEAFSGMCAALRAVGRHDEAVSAGRNAIRIKPDYAKAWCNLGITLAKQGELDPAIAAYANALRIDPGDAATHFNLGNAFLDQGDFDQAAEAYRRAIGIDPDLADAHGNLGLALYRRGKAGEAILACREAIRVSAGHAAAHAVLGAALMDQGKCEAATDAFREAIVLAPDSVEAASALLMSLHYDERATVAEIFEAHRAWGERHGRAGVAADHANGRETERRLKVGYVSPDFRHHSVAFFLEPLLRCHDRQQVEIFCYAEVKQPDATTERFRALADGWLGTVGMSDAALAERIRDDGIDILVDLAGHTLGSRLLAFARRPAPVQVTWLGYPNTTGLRAIDYRMVDAVTDPEGVADAFASETLVRLPEGFLCYGAPQGAASIDAPAAPPCLATGAVTFGSFNNPVKLSGATLDAWAALLARVPDSRLLLKGRTFADAAACELLRSRLDQWGIAAERLELVSWLADNDAHLRLYGRIDIALDPFPYNGTTTTCEALWMGVPVVTLAGDRHAGRVGAGLLTQTGLTGLIGSSVADYVEIASALAGDLDRLRDLRNSLRPRLAASPLGDAPAFARKIEHAYRAMWQRWCAAGYPA